MMSTSLPAKLPDRPRQQLAVLALMLLAAFALRLEFAPLISGNDDLSVANSAIRLLEYGFRVPPGHYEARFGMTVPLAAIFRVFGVGVPQLIVLPMVASLLGIYIAYQLGTLLFEPAVGLLGAAVLALYPMDVEFAGLFFPDLIRCVALAASFLLALRAADSRQGDFLAAMAGVCWAYAYYVKIDAFFMGAVYLLGAAMGFFSWRHVIIAGAVAFALVGIELVAYGVLAGEPFYHARLEHIAANEVLAPGMDYRNGLAFLKGMFVTPYEYGITFYLLVCGITLAVATRSRSALLLAGWVIVFFIWLRFGFDPFGRSPRLKPQLSRYLLDLSVPMCVAVRMVPVVGLSSYLPSLGHRRLSRRRCDRLGVHPVRHAELRGCLRYPRGDRHCRPSQLVSALYRSAECRHCEFHAV